MRRWTIVALLILLGSGLGAIGERSAYVVPAVAIAVAAWRCRPGFGHVAIVVGVVVAVLLGWVALGRSLPATLDAVSPVAQFQTSAAETDRLIVYSADLRGALERPLFGWGPGNTWSAYLSSATVDEVKQAHAHWGDAHDLPLEVAVTAGLPGLLALVALLGAAILRIRRGTNPPGWALASLVALAVFQLGEPLSLSVTPLLFLILGICAARGVRRGESASSTPWRSRDPARRLSPARWATAAVIAGAFGVSVLVLASSTLEQWGRSYDEVWAYRSALRLQPWRVTAAEGLAVHLALDGRSGDPAARAEAETLVADTVARHPWEPTVRLTAHDVAVLLDRPSEARAWRAQQLALFPAFSAADPAGPGSAVSPG
jgi:hypothetical protein